VRAGAGGRGRVQTGEGGCGWVAAGAVDAAGVAGAASAAGAAGAASVVGAAGTHAAGTVGEACAPSGIRHL
jgi:hypothetical protein